jgi:hypothetical protein
LLAKWGVFVEHACSFGLCGMENFNFMIKQ